jgi:glycosyltransferase involved in cell wall biosynthesis
VKLLLVGPYPPPHGGVSVHVRNLRLLMEKSGVECRVLNVEPRAARSEQYIAVRNGFDFVAKLARHAAAGWVFHVHTNGHNAKSWLVSLVSGLAAQIGPGCRLTLHSGILPAYLCGTRLHRRVIARMACRLYDRIICVNDEIRSALLALGVPEGKLKVREAYLEGAAAAAEVPAGLDAWLKTRSPLLATTMFMRPEYGYEVLRDAMRNLRTRHPSIGCVVMGIGGASGDDALKHAGDVAHDECLALISRSDVFVRPTFQDGDSISVREAHALGVPVVASRVGTRPHGTRLFEAGDVRGLVEQIERAIAGAVRNGSPGGDRPVSGR